MKPFNINFLDHVAIRVKDMQTSINWYQNVLGLKKYQLKEWDDYPVFMLSGKSGIAIFPANIEDETFPQASRNVKIDHFAFNVSNDDFNKAKAYLKEIQVDFGFMDHIFFHSIYLKDPDNHVVELTTLLMEDGLFYK